MPFIDSTVPQRVELLRQAEKVGNLTRRVTVGSGNLGAPEGVEGDSLCTALSSALTDIGYGISLTDSQAIVDNASLTVVRTYDNAIASSSSVVAVNDSTLRYVTLPTAIAVVGNEGAVVLANSSGTVVGSSGTAVVSGGALTKVNLPATTAPTTSSTTPALQNSTGSISGGNGTVTVTNGAIANIKAPATTAIFPTGYALTGVEPTGTYTSTVTFTVAGGVITAITLA